MIPAPLREALPGLNANGVVGPAVCEHELHVRAALQVGDHVRFIEGQLEAGAGIIEILKDGHLTSCVGLHPNGDGECFPAANGRREIGLRLPAEDRRPAYRTLAVGDIAADYFPVTIEARCVRQVAIHLIVGQQALSRRRWQAVEARLLPSGLQRGDFFFRQLFLLRGDLLGHTIQLLLLRGGRKRQHRLGVAGAAVQPLFRYRVEEREELVELLLLDGIVLVIVAAGAAQGHSHPHGGGGFHAVDHVLSLILLRNGATLEVDHVVAIETGGDFLLLGGLGKQIAGELLHGEAVERHVAVERVDHPVAPGPHVAMAVDVIAVCVGVTGEVEPLHGHALAVVRRGQQRVDPLLVGVGRFVGFK